MADADTKRLMDSIRAQVPGALDAMIQIEMFNSLDDFFKRSNCWTETIEFDITPGASAVEIVPTGATNICRLLWVREGPLMSDRPIRATMPELGTIYVYEDYSQLTTLYAKVCLTVAYPLTSDGYPQFPAWVLDRHFNAVLSGVLSRLMSQQAKPYSNTQMAAYHGRVFNNGVTEAYIASKRENAAGAQPWSFPQTFNRRK